MTDYIHRLTWSGDPYRPKPISGSRRVSTISYLTNSVNNNPGRCQKYGKPVRMLGRHTPERFGGIHASLMDSGLILNLEKNYSRSCWMPGLPRQNPSRYVGGTSINIGWISKRTAYIPLSIAPFGSCNNAHLSGPRSTGA